jgi:predicted lipoprotein with Yx(FWY)xxD motif
MEFTTASAGRAHRSRPAGVGGLVTGAAALAALALGIGAPAAPAGATSTRAHAKVMTIHVSTATVQHVGTVLTTSSGLTLYRYTSNPVGRSVCTGACAKIWPPLTAAKGDRIAGPKGLKGLSVIDVGHGRWQVAFHDVALYRFEGDTKKGQAKGQALEGLWFAVLKSGIPAPSANAATTPTTQPATPTTTTAPAASSPTRVAPSPVTTPPATTPQVTMPPATTPPSTQPPTTTPTTQPQTTTPTSGGGGYGY